jgi:hypothetical protein
MLIDVREGNVSPIRTMAYVLWSFEIFRGRVDRAILDRVGTTEGGQTEKPNRRNNRCVFSSSFSSLSN